MLSNEVQAILSQSGHQLVVHTIVTGGQSLLDTLHGAAQLVKQLDAARFVIWLNPFWGPVADNGRTFEQMNLYEAIKKRIETIVSLPAFTDELFPQDIASMLKSRLTFKEAIESSDHSLMSRHRLKVAQGSFIPDWTAWPYEQRRRSVSVATSEGTRAIHRSERSAQNDAEGRRDALKQELPPEWQTDLHPLGPAPGRTLRLPAAFQTHTLKARSRQALRLAYSR